MGIIKYDLSGLSLPSSLQFLAGECLDWFSFLGFITGLCLPSSTPKCMTGRWLSHATNYCGHQQLTSGVVNIHVRLEIPGVGQLTRNHERVRDGLSLSHMFTIVAYRLLSLSSCVCPSLFSLACSCTIPC